MSSFRLALEGKACLGIPNSSKLKFSGKISENHLASSESVPLNRGGIADLPFLRGLSAILQISRESIWGCDRLSCLININKLICSVDSVLEEKMLL